MKSGIAAIAFDLEGTLIDVERSHHLGHLATARELGVVLSFEEACEKIRSFIGGPDEAVAAELQQLSGSELPVEEIVSRTREHYIRLRQEHPVEARPGVLLFLRAVKDCGYKIALGSVTKAYEGQLLLEAAGLVEFFPERNRVFIEDVALPKPSPAVYIETARRAGVDPHDQLVFEDSPGGIAAAFAAGSIPVAVPTVTSEFVRSCLTEAGAIAIFETWFDVTLPRVIEVLEGLEGREEK
jgi:beta-phosphoglucomutase